MRAGRAAHVESTKNVLKRTAFVRISHPGAAGTIILKWMLQKLNMWLWTGCVQLTIGTCDGSCEFGNERAGSIKSGKFLD